MSLFQELRSHLETSLSDGTSLLVMDCDVKALATDDRFINVILNRQRFISGTTAFKIMVCLKKCDRLIKYFCFS